MCLSVFLLRFILYGTLCTSWTWVTISFLMLGKFLITVSSNIFSGPFSFSSSGTPTIQMLLPEVSETVLISFHSFFFILFCDRDFHHSVFQVTYPFFCLSYSLLIPASAFFTSVNVLFISVCSLVLLRLC